MKRYTPNLFFIILILIFIVNTAAANHELYYRLKAADTSMSVSKRILYIDSIISLYPDLSDSLLLESAQLADYYGLPAVAAKRIEKIIPSNKHYKTNLPVNQKFLALYTLTAAYFKNRQYAEAIETGLKLLHTPKPDSLTYYDIKCLTLFNQYCPKISGQNSTHISSTSISSNLQKAEHLLQKLKKSGVSKSLLNDATKEILISRMLLAIDNRNFEDALKLGAQMLQYPMTAVEKIALEGNLAMIYSEQGNQSIAEEYYQKILSDSAWHINHAVNLGNYMFLLIDRGEPQKALELWNQHQKIVELAEGHSTQSNLLNRLSFALAETGNLGAAFHTHLQETLIKDSINERAQGALARKLIETINKDYDTQENLRRQKTIGYGAISLSTLLIFICIGVSLLMHKRLRKLREETNQSERLLSTPKTVNNTEEEQVTHVLMLASINETVSEIKSIVEESSGDDHSKIAIIKGILKNVNLPDNMWDAFLVQFNKLHPSFFPILKQRHPNLTPGELRMCAYSMLDMSNKEIATLSHRSIRSVETTRYRLMKKLQLHSGESLLSYLLTLSPAPKTIE